MDDESQLTDEIKRLLHRKPFSPFMVILKSGEKIEVTRRFQLAIADENKTIGIMVKRPGGMAIKKSEIARVDALEPAH